MKVLLALLFLSSTVWASEIEIKAWYKLNRNDNSDLAAEVCFSLTPKPEEPLFVEVIVDAGRRSEAVYNTWVGPRGSACKVVSTASGLVEVSIPFLKVSKILSGLDKK